MFEHHKRSLERLVEILKPDPQFLAVITAGSIARGKAKPTSDVDVYLLVTDKCFDERKKEHRLFYINHEACDYDGGYIDGKIVNLRFLELAAEKGSEPTRASFLGSRAFYSKLPGLDSLLPRIAVYPERNRERNLIDFYAQVFLHAYYFAGEGESKNNRYLLSHAASNLVLFGGRIVLAHNRILFPCHKSLMNAVASAPEKPERFVELATDLLGNPSYEKCKAFADMMLGFREPGITYEQAVSLFVDNNEWNWIDREPPLADR